MNVTERNRQISTSSAYESYGLRESRQLQTAKPGPQQTLRKVFQIQIVMTLLIPQLPDRVPCQLLISPAPLSR